MGMAAGTRSCFPTHPAAGEACSGFAVQRMPPIAVVLRMPGVRVAEGLAHTLRMRPGCDTFLAQAQGLLPVFIPLGFGAAQGTAVRTFSN